MLAVMGKKPFAGGNQNGALAEAAAGKRIEPANSRFAGEDVGFSNWQTLLFGSTNGKR
jgi:hypothetical protein